MMKLALTRMERREAEGVADKLFPAVKAECESLTREQVTLAMRRLRGDVLAATPETEEKAEASAE